MSSEIGKMKESTLYSCYMWLMQTIYSRGQVSKEDIDKAWSVCQYNDTKSDGIPDRTFYRWRNAVEEMFDIDINYSTTSKTYSINRDEMDENKKKWVCDSLAINSILHESKDLDLKKCVFFETIPSGNQYLSTIISAIREREVLEMVHCSFGEHSNTYHIYPYCLKVFRQRWYVLAFAEEKKEIRVFALDRVEKITPADRKFKLDKKVKYHKYFDNIYGVSYALGSPENVQVKVFGKQRDYLRSLPIHNSQKEIKKNDEFSIFEFNLYPNTEFKQYLIQYMDEVEVLTPKWLRNEFAERINKMAKLYKTKK